MKENIWTEIHDHIDYLWSQDVRNVENTPPEDIKKLIILLIKATPKKLAPCINRIDPENEVLSLIAEMMAASEKDYNMYFLRIMDRLLMHSEQFYIKQIEMLFIEKADNIKQQNENDLRQSEIDLQQHISVDNKQRI